MAKSQLSWYLRWIVELKAVLASSQNEVGRQNSWGEDFSQAVDCVLVISPDVELKLYKVLKAMVFIEVGKLDDGFFRKAIVEAYEEIGHTESLRIICYH